MESKHQRILSGIVLVLIFFPIAIYGGIPFYILMLIISLLACNEIINVISTANPIGKSAKIFAFAGVLLFFNLVVLSIDINPFEIIISKEVIIASLLLYYTVLMMYFVFSPDADMNTISTINFSILYVGLGSSAILAGRFIDISFFIYVILLAFLSDIFAYEVGRRIGKHKMAPVLSPKKSYEGLFGGMIIASIISVAFVINAYKLGFSESVFLEFVSGYYNTNAILTVAIFIIISMIGVLVSVVGDLLASKIKRNYDVKDYSNLIPGHGGILDRFDSTLLSFTYALAIYLLIIL